MEGPTGVLLQQIQIQVILDFLPDIQAISFSIQVQRPDLSDYLKPCSILRAVPLLFGIVTVIQAIGVDAESRCSGPLNVSDLHSWPDLGQDQLS